MCTWQFVLIPPGGSFDRDVATEAAQAADNDTALLEA